MPKAQPTSVEQYLAALPAAARADVTALHRLICKAAPKLEPVVQRGFLGYGPFHYRYASGREGDACRISLASRKTGVSLYVLAADEQGYLVEQCAAQFPKAKAGKSCLSFKRLADVDIEALVGLIKRGARMTGPGELASDASATKPKPRPRRATQRT